MKYTMQSSRPSHISPMLAGALTILALTTTARAVEPNTRLDGYRGIWFNLGQENEYGPKYSGGLGTYTANHVPICIYVEKQNKTFFVYGGIDDATGDLLIMASYYDHATCQVPRPTVVHHKVGVNDPHDNGALLIDRDGYLWVFISGRGRARTGWLYRSTAPYSIDAFEWKKGGADENFFEKTYPQPWYIDNGVDQPVFLYMFTKYTAGRELYWSTSTDGVNWAPDQKMAGYAGHYQTSCQWKHRIGTAFNYHPGGSVDRRTNLYYLQTDNIGATWTTANGTPVTVPLSAAANPALVVDYEAQGLLCYINDTNFDAQGRPYIIYETSHNYAAGPAGDPRTWHLARWDGTQWIITDITNSDHNYDMGSLWIEGSLLRIIGPTENGPQVWGAGGEVAVWTSPDLGANWTKTRDVTQQSAYNHSYVRRPVNGRDPFFAMWADGDSFQKSESRLYFCNRAGTHVWRLPQHMSGEFAHPARVTQFGASEGGPVWRSPFETMAAGPVVHDQQIADVRNARGAAGIAAGATPLTYAAYGQPDAGTAPTAGAGSFAAALPNDRSVAINTALISNAGNLQNALTFEGFFRTPDTAPITSPTFVGRRLVTQKRGTGDDSSRLAIGLHAGSVPGSDGLFDYEGFNYTGTTLEGQSGGTGFSGAWTNATTFAHLSNDGLSITSTASPFTPVGSRISGKGGTSARPLSRPVDLSAEGTVTYLSALMRKTSTNVSTSHNLEIGLATSATVAGTSSTIRIGMTSTHKFFLTNSSAPAGTVVANTPYFVLVKIISHASTADECFMHVYAPGETVPATEPAWLLTHSLSSSSILTHLRLTIGANLDKGEIDEIRMGNTHASVIDPNAPIATGGGQVNLLSMYWHDVDAVNHLEPGITPILANTWYHFALTYNGTDIKWYLNGNLEGDVAAPNLVAAGTGTLGIGNNRISGIEDRGFSGLLDEIRISDQALEPANFLLNGGSCDAACGSGPSSVLWCSGFEAAPNAPVTHQEIETRLCGAVENIYGAGGTAIGTADLSYVGYDQPGVGTAPHAEAGAFALSLPDDRTVAIDTSLPSNKGNLEAATTFEGFFNTAESGIIVSPDSIGRRLITQRRDSAIDTRLAIGLHGSGGSNKLSVLWKKNDGATQVAYGTTAVQAGQWYHFAMIYDGISIRWYLDGQLQGTVADADLISAGSASIVIGNRRTDGVADRGFYGMIDEVRIFDRALTTGELMGASEAADEPCYVGCNWPFADADADGDVDQTDFGIFQTCFTITGAVLPEPACHCFDRAGDEYIDAADLEQFMNCVTGPAVMWDHALTPTCIP